MTAPRERRRAEPVHLLDSNVLLALSDDQHVHHLPARRWLASSACPVATCPITQGALLRLLMQLTRATLQEAVQGLALITQLPRHRFWPDELGYENVSWRGVLGHRQVTDAYLAALARHHGGKLATFDRGLSALHADVAVGLAA